jgi:predicted nucleic acid-binding protein
VILYLDTSALVKLIHPEAGSEVVRRAVAQANALATSVLTRIEVHATLARLGREGASQELLTSWFSAFARLWVPMALINMDRAVDVASGLCLKHPLRSLDAIHLASALRIREEGQLEVAFATADRRLGEAARKEGFALVG